MITRSPHGEGVVRWVDTEWLEERLCDDELTPLDCQPNVHDYLTEHLSGAVYFNEGLLRVPRGGLPAVYIDPEALELHLRRIGLERDKPVVVYTGTGPFKGWGDGLEQTMLAYTLARFGLRRVYLLDGGLDKWKAEGRPLTQQFPEVEPSTFTVEVQSDYYIERDELKSLKDEDGVILLDARPAPVYQGQGPWMKPGHIPGAVNLPWKKLMHQDNPRLLKPDDELKAIAEEVGAVSEKTVICSCGTGREATNEFLLFKWYLGYPVVRIYEGSFTEWSSDPANPTVTGAQPY